MAKALFEGLVRDESERAVSVVYVGADPTYVVTEDGMRYHIDARVVDTQVMEIFQENIKGHQPELAEAMMKFMGSKDLFTKVSIDKNLRDFDKNLPQLYEQGIPAEARQYLGMMGFRVVINRHGDLVKLDMPSAVDEDEQ
ncbi:MAG: hypothetical protein KIH69_007485 [Anaerolineae bacterium]|nr:hypothetical protein [Anaerolineae bacterium]